jgi:UDP-galactopyranose mutase
MKIRNYDFIIIGSGLMGSIIACELNRHNFSCLIIEKRSHIGGNVFTENINNINIHKYGAHIFHTNNKKVWKYVNSFAEFNRFTNSPMANYKGKLYNLPFNMNTFYQMWGVTTPQQAAEKIEQQRKIADITEPQNLEEQAISLVGSDIYNTLIKEYTEKQWGRKAIDLPAFIIKRLPVRFTYDNNYFNDRFQGIPVGGYTKLFEKMLNNIEICLNTDFFTDRNYWLSLASKIIYTGPIDQFFDFKYGQLEYRSLKFETELLEGVENFQGNAVINYTNNEIPYTRIIEHKHFEFGTQPDTIITREYSEEWDHNKDPYYPINDNRNINIYNKYKEMAENQSNVIFAGRLAEYKYYDMYQIIENAFDVVNKLIEGYEY